MPDQSFRVIITAVDKATAVMRNINRETAALARPFTDVGVAAGRFLEASGFDNIAKGAENAFAKVEHLGRGIVSLAAPLAGLAGAVSVAGLIGIAKGAADYGDQLYLASKKTGAAVAELARLHYVAQTAEVDAQQLDKALFQLNRRLADAAAGKNKDAAAMFAALHIPLKDGAGHVRTAAQVWGDLAEAINRNENAAIRARIVATAFGARVGADLIPALELGRGKTRELGDEFDRFHGKFTQADADRAHAAAEGWRRLGLAASGLKDAVGASLAPAIQPLLSSMTQWLAVNRQFVSQRVADAVSDIGDSLRQIDWNGIGESVRTIGNVFGSLFRALGPTKTALLGVAVVASPMILAFTSLAGAIAMAGARLALFALAPVTAALGNLIIALRAGYGAFAAFNLVMAANPVGLVIVGVAALAGAAYLIYKNWTPVSAFFKSLWSGMVDIVSAAVKRIGDVIQWLWDHSPLKMIIDALKWAMNLPGISTAVDALGKAFSAAGKVAMAGVVAATPAMAQNVVTPDGQVFRQPAPSVAFGATSTINGGGPVISRRNASSAEQSTNGQVNVKIDVAAPQGTKVRATATGSNPPPLDTGVRFTN